MRELERVSWPMLSSQIDAALKRIRRLEASRATRRRYARFGLAATVALVAGLAAVTPIRSAAGHFFAFGRERIEITDTLPPLNEPQALELGRKTSLERLERSSGALAVPNLKRIGPPDAAYVRGHGRDTQLSLLWGTERSFRLLFTQIPLSPADLLHEREVGYKRLAHPPVAVRVAGHPGLWIERFHEYFAVTPVGERRLLHARVARNVLLWHAFGLELRIEGRLTLHDAKRIAATVALRR